MSEHTLARQHLTNKEFFYGGASRGATLDALIYVLTHGEGAEGMTTVTGEFGSGKTTLCRMLMKRLPTQVQTVYLAQSASTPEEFLNLIIHQLKPSLGRSAEKGGAGNSNSIDESHAFKSDPGVVSELHGLLDERYAAGRRVVLLIDEAHELSAEILDELRILYELESPRFKLLQVVLFGQKELAHTLSHMRKLKGHITHHFDLEPLGLKAVNEYLISRIHAVGPYGPGTFTPQAVKLIGIASGGLIHQLNILADRSLGVAFSGNTRNVNADHVNAALQDTEIKRDITWRNPSDRSDLNHRAAGVGAALAIAGLGLLAWFALHSPSTEVSSVVASAPQVSSPVQAPAITPIPAPVPIPVPVPVPTPSPSSEAVTGMKGPQDNRSPATGSTQTGLTAAGSSGTGLAATGSTAASSSGTGKLHIAGVKLEGYKLLEQRVEATMKLMRSADKNQYTVQLFSTDNVQPDRMERFLARAAKSVDVSDIYVHPESNGDKAKFRVTYGIYPTRDQAAAGMAELPEKYQSSFQPEPVALADLR
jgi:type II secretory pathway predicted ATPase ExeA